ncbi:MAG: M28 family peptidase [Clostridiales bacterium]|nr:M28 family peptidase [Clostridiales bacterium]
MRKLLAITLAFALLFSLAIPSFGNSTAAADFEITSVQMVDETDATGGKTITVGFSYLDAPADYSLTVQMVGPYPLTDVHSIGTYPGLDNTVDTLAIRVPATFFDALPDGEYFLAAGPAETYRWPERFIFGMDPDCTIMETMRYLVDDCGVRFHGMPNEAKSMAYVEKRFKDFGYTDVEWAKIPLRSVGYTGMLAFRDGAADVVGNAYPASTAFSKLEGCKLVDLGTDAAYALPAGTAGDIVGAVRVNAATINATVINAIVTALNADPDVNVKGMVVTRAGSAVTAANYRTVPSVSGTVNVPTVAAPGYFFEKAVANAANFDFMERYARTETGAVYATKPAKNPDNPDLIIFVTAHIDTVLASPGAGDNGSSVASVVELARRYANVDNGNIEIVFAAVGAEDGGGMLGAVYLAEKAIAEGRSDIAININLDMGASPNTTSAGQLLSTVAVHTYKGSGGVNDSPIFDLPSWLILNHCQDVPMAPGITNYKLFNFGSTDHIQFSNRGIEGCNIAIIYNEGGTSFGTEPQYHTADDTLELNYSYQRNLGNCNLADVGIRTALDLEVSKRALYNYRHVGDKTKVTLTNASQLFNAYDEVSVNFVGSVSGTASNTFTDGGSATYTFPAIQTVSASSSTAYGTGLMDHKTNEYRQFRTGMRSEFFDANLKASLSVDEVSGIEGDVEYVLSVRDAEDLLSVAVEFEMDGGMLAVKSVEPLSGFAAVDGILWTYQGGDTWKGSMTLGYPAGGSVGYTSAAPTDIAVFTYTPRAIGDATMTLKSIKAVGYDNEITAYIGSSIENGVATTYIDKLVYSKYDLNKDGIVDALDLGIMLLYCGFNRDTAGWDTLVKVNDSKGKGVTASMCDVNEDGKIDMLDLLDLFIHYTK